MSIIAARYAQALFECASEQEKLDEVKQDIETLQKLASLSKDFNAFLTHPLLPLKTVSAVFRELSKKVSFCSLTLNFLDVLGQEKRLKNLNDIIRHFKELLRLESDILDVEVSSALPLEKAQRQSLTKLLKLKLKKDVVVHEKLDKTVIGGVMIRIGEYVIDSTIRTQLDKLYKIMRA